MARGGFPGGMGNLNNIMKQAQKMQQEMMKLQKELEEKTIEASAGGGAVTAVVNGKKQIESINIKPEVVDPDDVEMLEDLVMAAVNEAMRQVDEMMAREMSKFTGGMNLPGGLF
ncbi:MAG: YbaB/EbfC family nucleoid-associated protein [Clostridiales bacterium]|nr:YbaB/EbfC family nucleoid-associated protein [Clostridiales bacterium]